MSSHVQLCNCMDRSPPGSSVHGILQALENPDTGVGCHALLQGSFLTQNQTCVSHVSFIGQEGSLPEASVGSLHIHITICKTDNQHGPTIAQGTLPNILK